MKDTPPSSSSDTTPKPRFYNIIYGLKVRQIVIILFSISIIFYFLIYIGSLPNVAQFFTIFDRSPFPALADVCLTSAIVGFTFELLVRNEYKAEISDILRPLIDEQKIILLESIPQVMLTNKEIQREVIKHSKLEEIILRTRAEIN